MTGFLPFPEPLSPADADVAASGKATDGEIKRGRVFLLDGTALAYRGHFALINRPLTTASGQNVSALFVFATTLLRILDSEHPDYIAVAFDPKGKTFRHERYAAYKATRDKTPSEMVALLPAIRELVEGFNTPILELPGFEADDVIATVAVQAAQAGHEVFIVTGDKDFLQIVSPQIKLYNIVKTDGDVDLQTEQTAIDKFGVAPNRVRDLLALMGDSSDNIPGVAGVGKKTAAELVDQFGSVEEIYERLDEVKRPALRKKLEEGRDNAFLSKELVTFDLDVPVHFDAASFAWNGPDPDKLKRLFREYEMNALLKRISIDKEVDEHHYEVIAEPAALRKRLATLDPESPWAVEWLPSDPDHRVATLLGVAISPKPTEAFFVPFLGDEGDELFRQVASLFESTKQHKVVHDAKLARLLLWHRGIESTSFDFDAMIASYCVAPGEYQHDLDSLALRHLNFRATPRATLTGTGRAGVPLAEVEVPKLGLFACERADLVGRLVKPLREAMHENGVESLFHDVEMPLAHVLEQMERHGIAVDRDLLAELSATYQKRVDALADEVHDLAGEAFNIKSTKQLGVILFEKLEIQKEFGNRKKPRRTKTGYSTDAAALDEFRGHPIIDRILEYRMLTKLMSTYIDALPLLVNKSTRRIHTSFNQTVAATGRLSSSDPNLQNIPIRTEAGRQIRRAFVTQDDDHVLVSADYSQVELRIVAHLSDDQNLKRAFQEGMDVHRWTASLIFGMKPDDVPAELRGRAKTINFGVIYGMGPHRLANETGMSNKEATEFIEAYFQTFSGVKRFLDQTLENARRDGYVTTLLGRRRNIPDLDSKHSRIAAAARNMAINTPVQGTAADLIKVAMIHMAQRIEHDDMKSRMLLQVHDELLFEAPKDEVDELSRVAREVMEGAFTMSVPLAVDIGVGSNWLAAH